LRPQENEDEETPVVTKVARKRKLLTADSEIEISKKEYSSHLKDTTNIIRKVPSLTPLTPQNRINMCSNDSFLSRHR
jgi:hypothetical protein